MSEYNNRNLIIEVIIRRWGSDSSCYTELRYLFDDAPKHLLKKGKKFILFDGPNEIAKGELLNGI